MIHQYENISQLHFNFEHKKSYVLRSLIKEIQDGD
jgi:hypothetical protein